ncbi:MAG TPA: PBP1A family penicillin-binding protein [Deltaproteobacteria bacterium]|jgi:penicillin-binding protein 1A|nr:PBP1A family penicillin-binding protein [Deltaproteobacteria bacterium]HOI07963.1 PBP1A family penicillin-binding protein [Deltaproteobacteria bacterium]
MKWVKILIGFFAGLLVLLFLLVGAWMYLFVLKDLPSIHELKHLQPTTLTTVVASDGRVIGAYPPDGMIIMEGKDIPVRLKQAFISAEDSSFYRHAGLDLKRIISALIVDIRATSFVQGASTITQQVIRSYLLSREKKLSRKLKEIVLALRIEKTLTKDEILDLYLNRVYLGSGAYGVGAAALRYFDKECRDLTLAEMAMIAGVAPAPGRYSPLNDLPAAKRRQNYVLSRMVTEGYITEAEAEAALREPLMIKGEPMAQFSQYPYVTDYVKSLLIQKYGEEILARGVKVQTSLSPRLEDAAIQAVRKGVVELEMRLGRYRGPVQTFSENDKTRLLAFQANQLAWQGPKLYQLYWGRVQSVTPLVVDIGDRNVELGPDCYAWINPKGKWRPTAALSPGDMVRLCSTPDGFILFQDPKVQALLVAFDLETGGLLAMVGGVDYTQSQFNRAVYAKRQSGSAIKPFIYAAAIDKGYTPSSIIFDSPVAYQAQAEEELWQPKNIENKFYGATTLRTGLVRSRNVVTVKILKDIGIDYALSYLRQFDMGTEFPRDLSLALGSGVVIPYNFIRSFGVFACYGQAFEPYLISSITHPQEGTIFTASVPVTPAPMPAPTEMPPPIMEGEEPVEISDEPDTVELSSDLPVRERIISEQTAYIITNILCDAVQHGTGWKAKALGRMVAGKTGTSDENRDAWFVGYTPDVLCGVWIGYDDNMESLGKEDTGGTAAAPIFTDFMRAALSGRPVKDFRVPDGIIFSKIDAATGQPATEASTEVRFEIYKGDNVPQPQPEQPEAPAEDQFLKEIY